MSRTIAVFGDAILDRDVFVQPFGTVPSNGMLATRARHLGERTSLGGAGRVAVELSRRGRDVCLYTLRGRDEYSRKFSSLAEEAHVELCLRPDVTGRTVSVKHRYWAAYGEGDVDSTLMLHVDQDATQVWSAVETAMFRRYSPDEAQISVIVDHSKGFCSAEMRTEVMRFAEENNHIVLVDPGDLDNLSPYSSRHVIFKLNARQAQCYLAKHTRTPQIFSWDERQPEETYYDLMNRMLNSLSAHECEFGGLWLTLGPGGMLYATETVELLRIRTSSPPTRVRDTCGAGDKALAVFASSISRSIFTDKARLEALLTESNSAASCACEMPRWTR